MRARTTAALATTAVTVSALAWTAAAVPAWAKSDVALHVSAHSIRAGHPVRATASGGSDVAGAFTVACVQVEHGRHWVDSACSRPVGAGGEAVTSVLLRPTRPGVLHVRARLLATDRHGHHRVPEQVSVTAAVHVVR